MALPQPIAVGDLIVRLRDGTEGVVTAMGDERQPWWEKPHHPKNRNKLRVRWLPHGPSTWASRRTEDVAWHRAQRPPK